MGVVNVTPDSFSDGGDNLDPADAVATARRLLRRGGRPRRRRRRVDAPRRRRPSPPTRSCGGCCRCCEAARADVPVSIDTVEGRRWRGRPSSSGALLVNDVTALRGDPDLAGADRRRGRVRLPDAHAGRASHDAGRAALRRRCRTRSPAFLEERLAVAVAAGIPEDHVCLDPGIGFGKTPDQNLELIRGLERLCRIGRPVLVGLSRKSTLARVLGDPIRRSVGTDAASVGAAVAAFDRGASALSRPRRRCARRGAGRSRRSGAGERRMTIELHGIVLHGFHGVLERRASRRPALPGRCRARPRARAGVAQRSDRGRRRLPARSSRGSGRSPTPAPTSCSRPSRPRSPTRSSRSSPSPRCACGCASRTSCSTRRSSSRPSPSSAAGSRGRDGARLRRARSESRRPGGDADARDRAPRRAAGNRGRRGVVVPGDRPRRATSTSHGSSTPRSRSRRPSRRAALLARCSRSSASSAGSARGRGTGLARSTSTCC